MKNFSLFSFFFVFSLLFLVLGMTFFGMLNFFFGLNNQNAYIIVVTFFTILFFIGTMLGKIKIRINNYLRFFFVFFIVVTLAFLLNSSGDYAKRKYLLFLCGGVLMTIFTSSINQKSLEVILRQMILYSIFNFIILSAMLLVIQDVENFKWLLITELNLDVISFSRALGLGIVASFFFFRNKFILLFITVLLFYFMYLLNEIGPVLAVIICFTIFYAGKSKTRFLFFTVISIILFLYVIPLLIPDLSVENIFNDPRIEIYNRNFGYFLDNTLIGIGVAGIVHLQDHYQSAHNIFLEIATEYGILGLIPFLFMVTLLIKKFLRNKSLSISYIWLYSFIVVQFSSDISLNTLFWFTSSFYMITPEVVEHIYIKQNSPK